MQGRKAEGHVNYDVTESQEAAVIFLHLSNLSDFFFKDLDMFELQC